MRIDFGGGGVLAHGTRQGVAPWPPDAAAEVASGQTFLSAAIHCLAAYTDAVIVVAGRNSAALAPVIYAEGGSMVVNPQPELGQFSSLRVGLHEVLNRGRDGAITTLVDRPPVSASTLERLLRAFELVPPSKWAVVPQYAGKHGHPILLGREMVEAFLRAEATSTAREVEHGNLEHIEYVTVEDPFIALNVNTPEDYATLVQGATR